MEICSECCKPLFYSFFSAFHCSICGRALCSDCIKPVDCDKYVFGLLERVDSDIHRPRRSWALLGGRFLCPSCCMGYELKMNNMEAAINSCHSVKTFSINYEGGWISRLERKQELRSSFYEDRDDAVNELRSMAKYLDCQYVIDLSFNKDTGSEPGPNGGTHYYTVWQATGCAARKR